MVRIPYPTFQSRNPDYDPFYFQRFRLWAQFSPWVPGFTWKCTQRPNLLSGSSGRLAPGFAVKFNPLNLSTCEIEVAASSMRYFDTHYFIHSTRRCSVQTVAVPASRRACYCSHCYPAACMIAFQSIKGVIVSRGCIMPCIERSSTCLDSTLPCQDHVSRGLASRDIAAALPRPAVLVACFGTPTGR
jgi:hypothetical protein